MEDRHDPMQAYADDSSCRAPPRHRRGARATFGRLEVEPGGTQRDPVTRDAPGSMRGPPTRAGSTGSSTSWCTKRVPRLIPTGPRSPSRPSRSVPQWSSTCRCATASPACSTYRCSRPGRATTQGAQPARADGDAVRPQPDRRLALTGRVRRGLRLRGRRRSAGRAWSGTSRDDGSGVRQLPQPRRSTARCAAASREPIRSGRGATRCTPSRRRWTPTCCSTWPGRRTPR